MRNDCAVAAWPWAYLFPLPMAKQGSTFDWVAKCHKD